MKCPKCESNAIYETRLDVIVYNWLREEAKGEAVLDCTDLEETLLPLSARCRWCNHRGMVSEFELDRQDLVNPILEDKEGKYVEYLIAEGKVRIYPNNELLKDLQKQLGGKQ